MDFDVVLGIDSASFSAGVDQLNKDPKSHDEFFKGEYEGNNAQGTWEVVDQSPAFEFRPPTADKWQGSIGPDGRHPTGDPPTDNVFLLSIPSLRLDATIGGQALPEVSPAVEFYARAVLDSGTASLTPLAIWADESQLSAAEKAIVNGIVLPQVFQKLSTVLSGHAVPPQKITFGGSTLELTLAAVLVTDSHLVVVATADTSTATTLPSAWPDQPVFAIVNHDFAQHLAASAAEAHKGVTLLDEQSSNAAASLSAKAVLNSVDDIAINQGDATSWSAALDVSFDVSASVLGAKCALKKSSDSL
ncbi:hypothetical protein [Saccharothrix xinjiangensis]|uniref:Uncharacterized protein n=1 Tax=Saccharothrix xinjiangensis TaxID=204798 RepID=A0ABV9XZD9_9PSEU